ncbi:hypothetical protein [Amycolatopsis sp. ATCC 39116]|uniref:hypothetical protein n=1 Tax=Amycolatopsis sp. (strain ATCC 39116 / 75iv2) TaxID=385957 RepID=UPI0002D93F9F|nr:hypothetical protein [Amycolatopsis sp. ATCC 39116]
MATYLLGVVDLLISEADEACSQQLVYDGAAFREMRTSLLPLENTCVFEDGTTYDALPSWINPVFFAGMAGAVVCAGTAIWRTRSAGCRS